MPRKPRIISSTGIYHIILRSVNQHIIFEEDSDYQKFLLILSDCKKKYDKYTRSGHLFQDRYYSVAIENESAFLSALKYIHNNPVDANICRFPSEYRWSSYNTYYGAKNTLINMTLAHKIAGSKESLLHYFSKETASSDNKLFKEDHKESKHFLTDEKALAVFKSLTHLESTSDVLKLGKIQRNQYVRELRAKGLTVKHPIPVLRIDFLKLLSR